MTHTSFSTLIINRGYFKVVKRYLNAAMVYFVGLKDLHALLDKKKIKYLNTDS